ncbi:hypothetical protein [Klebsiella pneumoniae]|uniref:hypothetical protein n=1 Tax=Klebsiella pneumoniae TaxID=573 RepID=UPI0024AF159F|nr:hypothetical protein [Klebsiella pneumoniae]MDI7003563.1 hypothetical protein [Klebsiella pneumoniae]
MANIEKLGSSSPEVLLKNATNLDKLVNDRESESLPDRFGVLRKTWHGMEMIFSRFIDYITGRGEQAVAAIGWQELGNWAVGLAVDNRQQIVYYNGSWYKYLGELEHVIAGDSPENDGGVWSAANPTGKWSNIGDAALRSNLGSGELPGARLVGLRNGTVYDAIRYLTPEMFGGVADGITNNDEAFSNINDFVQSYGSCVLYLSGGAYALTQWDIPEKLMVKGAGKQSSKLICTAPDIQAWFIRCAAKTKQQWQSSISDLGIFAGGRANIALLLSTTTTNGAVSKAHFSSLTVDGGVTDNLVLDGTQNSTFTDVQSTDDAGTGPARGVALLNGAAGNTFHNLEISAGVKNLEMRYDPTYPGASISGLQQAPNGNTFYTIICENYSSAVYTKTHAVHIIIGNNNTISNGTFVTGSVTSVAIDSGNYNEISGNSSFYSGSAVNVPAVINGGYQTKLDGCFSTNIAGESGIYHVVTSNVVRILSCLAGGSPWRIRNTAGNTANNIRHIDPMLYSSNAANIPPTQLDSGVMAVNSGSQLFVGTPAGVKQVPFYTQRNVNTSLMAYTAGSSTNTLSLNYQLTDGYVSEITIIVRGNTDRSHRAIIRINAEFTSATVAWYSAQILSAVYNDTFLSGATVSVSPSGMLTLSLTTNSTITEGDYRLDERILINIA